MARSSAAATQAPVVRDKPLVTYLNPEDRQAFNAAVKSSGLTVSAYLRAAITGGIVRPTPLNLAAVDALSKVNADQARLGNLLKLYLQDSKPDHVTANRLIADIRDLQAELKIIMRTIRT